MHPGHEVIDILGSGAFDWLLDVGSVGPMVLIPRENTDQYVLKIFRAVIRDRRHSVSDKKMSDGADKMPRLQKTDASHRHSHVDSCNTAQANLNLTSSVFPTRYQHVNHPESGS